MDFPHDGEKWHFGLIWKADQLFSLPCRGKFDNNFSGAQRLLFFSSHSPHDDDVAHTQHSTSRIIIIHILFWRAELTSAYCSVIQRRRHESSEYVGGGGFQTFDETNRGHWFFFFRGESFQLLLSMQFPERRMSGSLCAEVRAGKLPRKTLSLVVVYGAAQYLLNENRRCG